MIGVLGMKYHAEVDWGSLTEIADQCCSSLL